MLTLRFLAALVLGDGFHAGSENVIGEARLSAVRNLLTDNGPGRRSDRGHPQPLRRERGNFFGWRRHVRITNLGSHQFIVTVPDGTRVAVLRFQSGRRHFISFSFSGGLPPASQRPVGPDCRRNLAPALLGRARGSGGAETVGGARRPPAIDDNGGHRRPPSSVCGVHHATAG
jgi:hypothetical protein